MLAITGANGFVGSHLGEFLVKNNISVVGLVRNGKEKVVEYFGGEPHAVDYHNIDSLKKALDGVEVVYHFAGITAETKDVTFERDYVQVGKTVIEACKQTGVRKIIFNSGLGVAKYGKTKLTSNKYFLSRLKMEQEIQNSNLAYTIFRPSTIIGSGNGLPWDELTPTIVEGLRSGRVTIVGDGKNLFQPIFIDDAVRIYHACTDRFDNKIFDLVGPDKISMMNYADMLAKNLKLKVEFEFQSPEEAQSRMTEEEVDIMMLNETSDHTVLEKAFQIKLTHVETAIERMFKNL